MPIRGWHPSEETRTKLRLAWNRRRSRLPGFWDRVIKTDGCWVWGRGLTGAGYGEFQVGGRVFLTHRYAYELVNGPIPQGLELDHLCRNRRCVRPDHLEAVTPRVNQHRGEGFSGVNHRKTHCVNGHLLAGPNLQVQQTGLRVGRRRCAACHRERRRKAA